MKKRHISKVLVSLFLISAMLFSLTVSVFAADSHDYNFDNTTAVYPAEPYTYTDYPSPDSKHILRVRHNSVNGVTYYDALVLTDADGKVLREFDLHRICNYEYGYDGYGVHWSPNGKSVVVDHTSTEHGHSVFVIDVKNREYWMPPSTVDNYNAISNQDDTLRKREDGVHFGVWKFEEWQSAYRASLITQYITEEGMHWARMVINPTQRSIPEREWGVIDGPTAPIWTKAEAIGAPAYNNRSFTVASPNDECRIIVNAAVYASDSESWSALYSGATVLIPGRSIAEIPFTDYDNHEQILWHDVIVKFSPDSRYAVFESDDADAACFVFDIEKGDKYYLYRNSDVRFSEEIVDADVNLRVEAFSVFGEVMYVTEYTTPEGEVYWTRSIDYIMPGGNQFKKGVYSGLDGISVPDYDVPTVLTTKSGFKGFIALSKTHATGFDGLFRVGDQYKYLHMEPDKESYTEYVRDAVVFDSAFDAVPDGYRELYSAEGCWVLDENDQVVYAGTGYVDSCGNFILAVNLRMINPLEGVVTGMRLFDNEFRLILDRVKDTAIQSDGSVFVKYESGHGMMTESNLAHIAADGTVNDLGRYYGDLAEYRD